MHVIVPVRKLCSERNATRYIMDISTATNGNAFTLFSGFFFINVEQGLHKWTFIRNNMGVILKENFEGTLGLL